MPGIDLPILLSRLGADDRRDLNHSAKAAQIAENKSLKAFEQLFADYNKETVRRFGHCLGPEMPDLAQVDQREIELLLLKNQFLAKQAGILSVNNSQANRVKLAAPKYYSLPKIPRKYAELMKWWDMTRKNKAPKKIQLQAAEIKKKYLAKCQTTYKKYSQLFRSGVAYDQGMVEKDVERIGETTVSRAKTIVATETTRYYNQVRKEIYDESDAITHYLYVAIRDYRTTEWCKDRNGLVYDKKDEALLKKEFPPDHYNCRSEMLPLTPFNPVHLKLINDKSLARKNNKCKPLLPGWNE